ncbi:unnamed protein product [Urochloa humidicola]
MGGAGACAGADAADSSGKERDAWEAVTIVLRIATVGFSLASAIMTFTSTSTQCVYGNDGSPTPTAAGSVSYSDYGSFNYSAFAELLSAVLEGVVIWLEVLGKDEWASTVEFIDKLVLALTSTSAPLLLAVDNITSCGGNQSSMTNTRLNNRKLKRASYAGLGSLGSATAIQITTKLSERYSRKRPWRRIIIIHPPPTIIVPPPPPCPSPPPPPCPSSVPCSCSRPTVATPCCCENVGPWYPCSDPSS